MEKAGVKFGEIIERLAAKNGMTTVQMAQHYATLGVKYGDVLALIEAAGRRAIDSTISELGRLKAAAGQGSGGGGGGGLTSGFNTGRPGSETAAIQMITSAAAGSGGSLETVAETFAEAIARLTDPNQKWAEAIKALSESERLMAWAAGLGDIPATAHGGITNGPQIRQVGEGGREAIIPLSKLPDLMSRMMGGGNGGRPQITIMGDVYGWDDWVDKVGEANIEIEERGG